MKRVIIVHCWSGSPNYCWYPWAKQQLEALGFEVIVPLMPDTEAPKLSLWLPVLQDIIGEPDEETYLIGHSIGCAAIMRYLEQLPETKKVRGIVLIAGFTDNLNFEELTNFYLEPLDYDKIKSSLASGSILIHSDDDPFVPLRYGQELEEKLGAELVVLAGMKHFSGQIDNVGSCLQLPAVVEAIIKLSGGNNG